MALIAVLPALSAQQRLKAGISVWLIVQHRLINRNGGPFLFSQAMAGLGAICLVGELAFLLDEGHYIPFRLPVLLSECPPQIGQHPFFRQPPLGPFLIFHVWGLFFRVKPVQILAAAGISGPGSGMGLDLIQELLRLIGKIFRGSAVMG